MFPGFELYRCWAHGIGTPGFVIWEQPTMKMYGREIKVPRMTAWYGTKAYKYSGIINAPAPMPEWLELLRMNVQHRTTDTVYNSALLNLYRDGSDSVSWHADDEPELGKNPTIASLSFGATRRFAVKHRTTGARWDMDLRDGDLLIMRGRSQLDYVHSVPKTTKAVGPRVNITFRYIY